MVIFIASWVGLRDAKLITSGAMTARIDRPERGGLIERRPDPVDPRAVRIVLTEGNRLADRALHWTRDRRLAALARRLDVGYSQA